MSDEVVSFVKRNARRLFELWFYGEILSKDLQFQWQRDDAYDYYDEEEDESYKEILAKLSDTYGIEILVEGLGEQVLHDPLESHLRLGAAAVLSCELGIYSPSIIRKSHLEKVTLCGGIRGENAGCAGQAHPHAGEIVIEVAPLRGDWRKRRMCIHHEIFHLVDYFDDVLQYIDPWWESLNEKGFAYSKQNLNRGGSNRPGFVSAYAMSAVQEDKAEVFCHMIIEYKKLEQLSQSDVFLRRKIDRMKNLLRTFSPEFDQGFWEERLKAKPVSPHACGL
ncbi:MAG TPA: putative zinc-binding metallopeptidase [Candidatus Obscuribacterales bacterium]